MATSRPSNGRRITGSSTVDRRVTADGVPQISLDELAHRIIEQLREDGRRPYAAIGQAVGLSEAAVRQRVQRLLDTGVMRITAVTDPSRLGLTRQATVGIRAGGDLEKIADRVAELDEVDRVVITAGSYDLLTEVACRNDNHLLEVLQRLRAVDGVLATEAFVYLKSTPATGRNP